MKFVTVKLFYNFLFLSFISINFILLCNVRALLDCLFSFKEGDWELNLGFNGLWALYSIALSLGLPISFKLSSFFTFILFKLVPILFNLYIKFISFFICFYILIIFYLCLLSVVSAVSLFYAWFSIYIYWFFIWAYKFVCKVCFIPENMDYTCWFNSIFSFIGELIFYFSSFWLICYSSSPLRLYFF